MVTAAVGNQGVENSQDTFSKSPHTGVVCNVCLLCSEEDMREDVIVAALKAFFRLQREPNLQVGCILVIIRMLRDSWSRMAARSAGAAKRRLVQGAATHPIYVTQPPPLFSECKVN